MHPNQPQQPTGGYPSQAQQPTTTYPVMGTPAAPPPGGQFPATVHGRRPRPELRVRLGDVLAVSGALLVVLFSFAPFVGYTNEEMLERLEQENLPGWYSAWGLETFMAPLSWFVIFAALGVIGLVAARLFAGWDREVLGFRPSHLKVGLGLFSAFVLLGYALSTKTVVFGSELQDEMGETAAFFEMAFGWGGLLMLLGALLAATGTVLDHLNVGPQIWPLPQAQQPHPYGHPQPGYPAAGYPQGHPGHAVYQTNYPAEAYQPTQAYPQQPGQPYPGQPAQPYPGQPHPGQQAPPQQAQPVTETPAPPAQPQPPAAETPAPAPSEATTGTEQPANGAAGSGEQRPDSAGQGTPS